MWHFHLHANQLATAAAWHWFCCQLRLHASLTSCYQWSFLASSHTSRITDNGRSSSPNCYCFSQPWYGYPASTATITFSSTAPSTFMGFFPYVALLLDWCYYVNLFFLLVSFCMLLQFSSSFVVMVCAMTCKYNLLHSTASLLLRLTIMLFSYHRNHGSCNVCVGSLSSSSLMSSFYSFACSLTIVFPLVSYAMVSYVALH